jgi:hypothetical protein
MRRLLCAALAISASTTAALASPEAMICADRQLLDRVLVGRDQTWQRAIGMTTRGELLELYMAVDGNWTILSTARDGGACIVENGRAGEAVPIVPNA